MNRADHSQPPPLFGLILAGGKSTRMGRDKAALQYGGQTEPTRLVGLLRTVCRQVFLSVPADSPSDPGSIPDILPGIGPMGGILSAMKYDPTGAWLVVACDMPLLTAETIRFLVAGRAPEKPATCLAREGRLEPLCAVYEPSIAPLLRASVGRKEYSPRHVLAAQDVQILEAPMYDELKNINAPEEYEQARRQLENE